MDHAKCFLWLAFICNTLRFMVGNLNTDTGFVGQINNFLYSLDQFAALTAHMGSIDTAMILHHAGQVEHFFLISKDSRRIDKTG